MFKMKSRTGIPITPSNSTTSDLRLKEYMNRKRYKFKENYSEWLQSLKNYGNKT